MKWKPVDIIVGILVLALVAGMMMAAYDVVTSEEPIQDRRLRNIDHLIGAVISVISLYVGSRIKGKDDDG